MHPRNFGRQMTVCPSIHLSTRPSAPQGNQCSIPQFLASLGAQQDWYCTHIAHQCCDQLTAVKTGSRWPVSPDRIAGSGVDLSRSSISLRLSADKLLVFKWLQAQDKFFQFIWNMLCFICAAQLKFWFQTDVGSLDSASFYTQGRHASYFWLFSPRSRVGHALRPIFMLWLVKIWQARSCRKFMQHLETCLLWQLKLTEFCVNLWCF